MDFWAYSISALFKLPASKPRYTSPVKQKIGYITFSLASIIPILKSTPIDLSRLSLIDISSEIAFGVFFSISIPIARPQIQNWRRGIFKHLAFVSMDLAGDKVF